MKISSLRISRQFGPFIVLLNLVKLLLLSLHNFFRPHVYTHAILIHGNNKQVISTIWSAKLLIENKSIVCLIFLKPDTRHFFGKNTSEFH